MKDIQLILAGVVMASAGTAMAAEPQLCFHQGDQVDAVKLADIERIGFTKTGLSVSTATEEKTFSYAALDKMAFDMDGTTVGVKSVVADDKSSLAVLPSVVGSTMRIVGYEGDSTDVEIYSVAGMKVMSIRDYAGASIDATGMNQGIYIVRTNNSTAKFVKK